MTTEDVKEHNEKVLRNIERIELVARFAVSIGCSAEQASTISKAYAEKFVYDGAVLSFNGKPVTQAKGDVIAHFHENHLDFLLPAEMPADKPEVNSTLLERARNKNMTAYGQLVRQHGKAAIDALLAEKPQAVDDKANGKGGDHSNNPFHASNWNVTRQAALLRAVGPQKCAQIAAAVGSRIGATKPNPAY